MPGAGMTETRPRPSIPVTPQLSWKSLSRLASGRDPPESVVGNKLEDFSS